MKGQVIKNDVEQKKENEKKCDSYGFEEALTLSGLGRYNYGILLISVYSLLAAAAELFSAGIIVASAQCDLQLDVYKKGLIGSLPMLGVVCTAHLWGYIADTHGRKFSLVITMSGTVIFATIASLSNHWIMLAAMKLIGASFASGTNAVTFALLGEQTPAARRSFFLMLTATGVFLSQAFNSVFAYPVLRMSFEYYLPGLDYYYRPWRLLTFIYGLSSGVNLLLIIFFTFESPKYYFAKGENDKGLDILSKIYSVNTGRPCEDYSVKEVILQEKVVTKSDTNIFVSMWNQTVPLFYKENLKITLLLSYLSIVIYSVAPPMVIWLPMIFGAYSKDFQTNQTFCELIEIQPFADDVTDVAVLKNIPCDDHMSDFTIVCLCVTAAFFTITSISSVFLVKYIGKRWIIVGSHFLSACFGVGLNFIPGIGAVGMLYGMMGSVLSMGILTTYAVELFPTYLRAMGVCLTMMVGRAVSFCSIMLIGPQLETNCQNFMLILSALIFSASVAGLILPSDKLTTSKNKTDHS